MLEKDLEHKNSSEEEKPSITKEALKRSKDRHESHHFIRKLDDERHGAMRMQLQNDYTKNPENISYLEILVEAYNVTI